MALPYASLKPCPCQSGRSYGVCCEPLHAAREALPTAEALMRSRYAAYVLQDDAYLRLTWHPDTCPEVLDLRDGTRYQGLQVHAAGSDWVRFTAQVRLPDGRRVRLRELSFFAPFDGRLVYVNGEEPAESI